jgi:copper(I)-binding protein
MKILSAIIFSIGMATAVNASDIEITDQTLLVSGPMAKSAAAFMTITNAAHVDDLLISVTSDASKKTEIHTHIMSDDGIMQMRHVPGGLGIPAQGEHVLERGGDHVMFMGLVKPLRDGDAVELTLIFENAGEVQITLPVGSAK